MNADTLAPMSFTPRLAGSDPACAAWLAEATLRLRRELAWLRHGPAGNDVGADAVQESLDLLRFDAQKRDFLARDATARHLGELIAQRRQARAAGQGAWSSLCHRLALDEAAQFTLALALLARTDAASGRVIAELQHDPARTQPTLALAQRLWDAPADLLAIDPGHPLFRFGVLSFAGGAGAGWQSPLDIGALLAHACLFNDGRLPAELRLLDPVATPTLTAELAAATGWLAAPPERAQVVPLLGDAGCDFSAWASALAQAGSRVILAFHGPGLPEPPRLADIAAWAWLHDVDLLLPHAGPAREHTHGVPAWPTLPVRWLLPATDGSALRTLPAAILQPPLRLPPTDFDMRCTMLTRALGAQADGLAPAVREMARRFRIPAPAFEAIGRAAAALPRPLDEDTLHALCRAQSRPDLGHLARPVRPRFGLGDMVLPPAQRQQLDEITAAMRALTRVHHDWGAARAWNEAGLSVLFCGPPGTGKTMAAEAIARELGLPMFRIDLSQVVDKYIGETEKNLQRVFDAVEESDCLLFFDEADALFGKRTSVKDAHDRFANIEVSYLLERMERLKGIAVLATNRRKDLDDAFLRRLRYLVDFPLPGELERERLWRSVFPPGADTRALDLPALAKLFPLAGGHIRSIAFNACLQAAGREPATLDMATVLVAAKRELDKLNRPSSPESFGAYRDLVQPLFAEPRP